MSACQSWMVAHPEPENYSVNWLIYNVIECKAIAIYTLSSEQEHIWEQTTYPVNNNKFFDQNMLRNVIWNVLFNLNCPMTAFTEQFEVLLHNIA